MFARDYKAWALQSLRGRWPAAVAVCIIAGLLGGGIDMVSGVLMANGEQTVGMLDLAAAGDWPMRVTVTAASIIIAFVIGGALTLGAAHFFTNLTAKRPAALRDLFSRFSILGKSIWMNLVIAFYVFLWAMLGILPVSLFIGWIIMGNGTMQSGLMIIFYLCFMFAAFPGIIAAYRYAMVPYLIAEFPDLSVKDAMAESKRLMKGRKWRLFCLGCSFLGWIFVGLLTMGIANFWISPYINAAKAAFYLDATGRSGLRHAQPEEETSARDT